jgi:hypothetical protein
MDKKIVVPLVPIGYPNVPIALSRFTRKCQRKTGIERYRGNLKGDFTWEKDKATQAVGHQPRMAPKVVAVARTGVLAEKGVELKCNK